MPIELDVTKAATDEGRLGMEQYKWEPLSSSQSFGSLKELVELAEVLWDIPCDGSDDEEDSQLEEEDQMTTFACAWRYRNDVASLKWDECSLLEISRYKQT